jgi:hypothetical protein
MELGKQFCLAAVLRTEASAAENENEGIGFLEFGEFSTLRGVVGEFVVGEDSSGYDVRSHQGFLSGLVYFTHNRTVSSGVDTDRR